MKFSIILPFLATAAYATPYGNPPPPPPRKLLHTSHDNANSIPSNPSLQCLQQRPSLLYRWLPGLSYPSWYVPLPIMSHVWDTDKHLVGAQCTNTAYCCNGSQSAEVCQYSLWWSKKLTAFLRRLGRSTSIFSTAFRSFERVWCWIWKQA